MGPLVSIIVATRDRGNFLRRCLRSILDQTYPNIECIVVDGASKDESVNILNQLAKSDSRLKFISEPDEGEVYAVNKGIEMSRGEIIGFQASDDFYVLDAVEKSVAFLKRHPEFIGVGADARYVDEKGEDLGRGVVTYRGRMAPRTVKRLIVRRWKMCPVCHGSFFGWRAQMLRHGKLDPTFSVIPDWEYYLRLLKAGEQIGCLPRIHYKYTEHSGMGAVKSWAKVEAQRARLFEVHGITKFDRLLRATVGRLMSYCGNPYRTPLLRGLRREIGLWHSQRKAQPPDKPYAPASSGHV
jgi:glycosyltransferase involved in cell wall biosynthesis